MVVEDRFNEILASLERRYPGRIYLKVEEVARARGEAIGTVYNKISGHNKHTLGIRCVRIGNRPKFRIHDVARSLADIS